jgi:hypothetical protein
MVGYLAVAHGSWRGVEIGWCVFRSIFLRGSQGFVVGCIVRISLASF